MLSTDTSFSFSKEKKIKKSSEFAAVLQARGAGALRFSNKWFEAKILVKDKPELRFGFTVGKINARRSVDRVLIKRVLREVSRTRAPEIESVILENKGIDIAIRLKKKIPKIGIEVPLGDFKKSLGEDADFLLTLLCKKLSSRGKND